MNLTSLNDRFKLPAEDLAASLDILVELVKYNSKTNNSALNTSTDHQNVVQVASNLLEEQNAETWLYLQKVAAISSCLLNHSLTNYNPVLKIWIIVR